ncbi:hypothetical protein [Allobaculum sp. Allo2]|uniref:GlgB N-terminal domain-containing protein n=1 Tax=Allobaculum sp. Allo2 TaxID=2853432 RepID=UPI001F612A2A|nr:hypothetical protein [Allobaculum sp. Allo2]
MDLTAFFQGRELNAYEYFGAHAADDGIAFRVYAPNAKAVSVIGDFNSWDETEDVMKKDENGVWMATVKTRSREKPISIRSRPRTVRSITRSIRLPSRPSCVPIMIRLSPTLPLTAGRTRNG